MHEWTTLPPQDLLETTVKQLINNGFTAELVQTGEEAKKKVLEMLPEGSDVLVNTSITLETIGVMDAVDNSDKYVSVRKHYMALDHVKDADEIRKLRSTPTYAVGSAHAVTQDGKLLIASNSGSQLSNDVYGAKHLILIIGAQKVVKDIAEGEKRIYEHSLPLETVRARKAYGLPETWNSFVSKLLIYNREPAQGRVHVILVNEVLGF